jgi:hypothetical protein
VTGLGVSVMVAMGASDRLIDLSSVAVLAQYAATSFALIGLAWDRRHGLRRRDLWPAPLAMLVVSVLMMQATKRELLVALGVVVAAVGVGKVIEGRRAA